MRDVSVGNAHTDEPSTAQARHTHKHTHTHMDKQPTRKHEPYCHLLADTESRLTEIQYAVEQLYRQRHHRSDEDKTEDTLEAAKCVTQARDDVHNAINCLREALLFLDRDAGRRDADFTPLT